MLQLKPALCEFDQALIQDAGVELVEHTEQRDATVVGWVCEVPFLGETDYCARHLVHLLKLPHQVTVLQQHVGDCVAAVLQQLIDDALFGGVAGRVALKAAQAGGNLCWGDGCIQSTSGRAVSVNVSGVTEVPLNLAFNVPH